MAEAIVAQKSSGMSTVVIIVLIVVLIGGGVGAWFMLKPKKKDEPELVTAPKTTDPGTNSRVNAGASKTPLTAAQLADLQATNGTTSNVVTGQAGSQTNPYYINSASAQDLINKNANIIQQDEESMNIIRAKYDIGKAVIEGRDSSAVTALKNMFKKRPMADGTSPNMDAAKYWLSFPIYGTSEPDGLKIRVELQNIKSKNYKTLNLTDARDGSAPWWCPTLGLNLLIGTTTANTPSADQLWWHGHQYYRDPLDFYKGLNGAWVDDKDLLVKNGDGTGKWPAQIMWSVVDDWIDEIERLDKAVKWEALRYLMRAKANGGEGLFFSFLDPKDPTVKFYSDYNIPEDPTVKDTDPIIIPKKVA